MHVPSFLIAAAGLFLPTTLAVFADDAWNVDWHLALVGTPKEHTTFFHQPVTASKASLLYTLSDKAILGAVNPKDGSLRWRQQLSPSNSTFLRAGQDQDTVISAVDGEIAAWSAADGRQAWSLDLQGAPVEDLEILEIPEGNNQAGSKDALVLTGGPQPTVQRLGRQDGQVKWIYKDETGDIPFQLSASATHVYYISLHGAMLGGSKIKVVSLDPITGQKLDQYNLATESDITSASDILTVGANSASPIIAWTDKDRTVLKVNIIGTKGVSTFNIASSRDITSISLHAPYHSNARPHFLVYYETSTQNWAEVYHVDLTKSTVSQAYTLPKLGGKGAFSASTSDANVYFTRISESEVSVVSSASHGVLARWPLKAADGIAFQGDRAPIHAVSEVSLRSADVVSAVRCAVYLASGEWVLIRDGTPSWERLEALSSISSAVWAYLPTSETLVHELELEGHANLLSAYLHRVKRHVRDLEALPNYLTSLPSRLAHSIGLGAPATDAESSSQDTFGYHKKIICATENGRLLALDAGNQGQVMWNVKFAENSPSSLWNVPQLSSHPDGTVSVTSTDGKKHKIFDVATGKEVRHEESPTELPHHSSFSYKIIADKVVGKHDAGASLWQFAPANDESIYSLTPRPYDDPVASIGKVLGDRRVLYKYLNPNVLLVISVSEKSTTATVSVLDTLTGSVIYAASHDDIDTSLTISSTMSENWFAYSFASQPESTGIKGFQLVVGEMYESPFPNDRGPYGSAANASEVDYSYQPYVVTQTYRIREPISKMAVSQTRQGITSRVLLAVLPESNAIVGIPRAVIDPRRPVGRDATKDEMMEGLIRYSPVLDFDPKWYLNHQREVLGVEKITTSPAVLESTSLVFAHGVDVFGTRISPSFSFDVLGKDFNKLQMLATVAALAVATVFVAPLVSPLSFLGKK